MRPIICDKCGKRIKENENYHSLYITKQMELVRGFDCYQLCDQCYDKIKSLLRRKTKNNIDG